ncbi:hypothetical protein R1flu_018408 [Riccia fluitans]|uniref:RING-type E3 ubiquitin transferase n=1 Tax=Riccia fluitans TaxID=41844 RepID=A0ABD1ZFR2_9MARC
MFRGAVGNAVLVPISEVLARVLVQVAKTAVAAKDVLIERESFSELSNYLERLRPILGELSERNVNDSPTMRTALEAIDQQLKVAKDLMNRCKQKSRFYLLMQCRSIVKQIQDITRELGRCISLLPLATLDVSLETCQETKELIEAMKEAHFHAAVAEEEIIEKIESGIRERQTDSEFANDLLLQIAKAVGVSVDPRALKQELNEIRKEKEEAVLRKSQAEAVQLEQIIALLSRADAATTPIEKEEIYLKKRGFGGGGMLPPLQSFYCPITREVMDEPVEIASGQTFEKSAILTWFRAGNRTCPITKLELEILDMKPNQALRHSIEEWRERNTIIRISGVRPRLLCGREQEVSSALQELHQLSEEKLQHRHWIASEGLIPVLVDLLNTSNRNIRSNTLATLKSICVHNDVNKETVARAGAITMVVKSLARDVGEGRQAVALLLELSENAKICEEIGKAQGCILLLVTMLNSENPHAVEDAKELLKNLSFNDQNVVQMAEANHFKPLVHRLNEGTDMTKILMASALSRMGLTDQGRAALAKEGAVVTLVQMISIGRLEARAAALGALQNLSTLDENRGYLIDAGVVPLMLQLLFSVTSAAMSLKEYAAAILANIAKASTTAETKIDISGNILESDETIYQLLSLLNLAGPIIQRHLLTALLGMSSLPSAISVRNKLRTGGAIQLLLPFCEASDVEVRVQAVCLLYCISGDGHGREMAEHLGPTYLRALIRLVNVSKRDEERAAAMGVIASLPSSDAQLTQVLLEAEALPAVCNVLTLNNTNTSTTLVRNHLLENAVGALLRFTGAHDKHLLKMIAELDVITKLVQLLGIGTPLAKQRAAMALSHFSEYSKRLSTPIPRENGLVWFVCCSSTPEKGCSVHGGHCSVKGSFCLVAAEAVSPLVQTLDEKEDGAAEAALGALKTLLNDERWEKGAHVLAECQGINPIIRLLTCGTPGAKEMAVWILEKLFRIEKYRTAFGAAAQMPLIDLTQKGSIATKPLAAKILAHLNVLHSQSTYF